MLVTLNGSWPGCIREPVPLPRLSSCHRESSPVAPSPDLAPASRQPYRSKTGKACLALARDTSRETTFDRRASTACRSCRETTRDGLYQLLYQPSFPNNAGQCELMQGNSSRAGDRRWLDFPSKSARCARFSLILRKCLHQDSNLGPKD